MIVVPSLLRNNDIRSIRRIEIGIIRRFHRATTTTNKVNSTFRCQQFLHHRILRIVILGYAVCLASQYFMDVSAFLPYTSTCRNDAVLPFISTSKRKLISRIEFTYYSIQPQRHLQNVNQEYDATTSSNDADMKYDGDSALSTETLRDRYTNVLPLWLIDKCEECGYVYPTRIQEQVFDEVLLSSSSNNNNNNNDDDTTGSNSNRNLIVQSETGSGKTLAFLLPCLANIDASRSTVQVLIVVPTRELGLQISRVAKRLASAATTTTTIQQSSSDNNNNHNPKKIMIMSVLQGSQNRRQRAWAWAEPPHMIIGTPEELCTMIRSGGIKRYNSIKYLIVDEVDACLLNNIGKISSSTVSSTRGQSIQFTGTPLHELLSKYLSPTYDDGREALAMESDSASVTVGSSNSNNNNNSGNTVRPILQSRTTIFCSATIPQHRYFAKQCVQNQWMLHTPKYISLRTGSQHLPSQLKHTYTITSEPGKKLATLRRILKKMMLTCRETNIPNRVVVFSDHHRPFEEIAKVIAKDLNGFYYNERTASSILSSSSLLLSSSTTTTTPLLPVTQQHQALISVLRYEDSLSQRAIAMDALRGDTSNYRYKTGRRLTNESTETEEDDDDDDDDHNDVNNTSISTSSTPTTLFRVLLSTDLAARGLDIVDITHIIHMDLPDNADIYVHRSGRTGRLNRSGHVISIITQEQEFVLQRIMNQLQVDITCVGRPTTAISNTNEQ